MSGLGRYGPDRCETVKWQLPGAKQTLIVWNCRQSLERFQYRQYRMASHTVIFGLFRPHTVAVIPVPFASRCSGRFTAVHPAASVFHGRISAWLPGCPTVSAASGMPGQGFAGLLHGVVGHFSFSPRLRPPSETLPMTACPPSLTWTCWTVIVWFPPVRIFASVVSPS